MCKDRGAIESALKQVERSFGKGSIMRLNEEQPVAFNSVSTGSLSLDYALGTAGLPKGRIVEIYGPESSGKTTLALHCLVGYQKEDPKREAVFIDAEHALDIKYAERIGVDIENLHIAQPDYGEQALEIADIMIKSSAISVVVIDSVAALVPKAELDGDIGDQLPAAQARMMSQTLRKIASSVSKTQTTVIFINQIRSKIGVFFGSPETTTGGNALKYYASIRMDVRRIGLIKSNDSVSGHQMRVKVVKNKLAPPFKEAVLNIIYSKGIDHISDTVEVGTQCDLIQKSGSWYSYKGEKIGQGRGSVVSYLEGNPEIYIELRDLIKGKIFTEEKKEE